MTCPRTEDDEEVIQDSGGVAAGWTRWPPGPAPGQRVPAELRGASWASVASGGHHQAILGGHGGGGEGVIFHLVFFPGF